MGPQSQCQAAGETRYEKRYVFFFTFSPLITTFIDIITAILGAPEEEQPLKEDIEGIIGAVSFFSFFFFFYIMLMPLQRKSMRNMKAA